MAKKGKGLSGDDNFGLVTLSPEEEEIKLLQKQLEAFGYGPDMLEIHSVKTTTGDDGVDTFNARISLSLPPKQAEALLKLLAVKVFDPDKDTVSIGNAEVKLESVTPIKKEERKPQQPLKVWTDKERGRRSKPKSTVPDVD